MLSNLARILKREIAHLGKNLTVLDCGCGKKPYSPFFRVKCKQYIGIDIERNEYVDVIADIEKLPLRDETFDLVLCFQVIEHAPNPQLVADEIRRVLKHGKPLFLSTHGIWPIHGEPSDFWRWTRYGLQCLLANFSDVRVLECGGSIASLFQILNFYVPRKGMLKTLLYFIFNRTGEILDKRFRKNSVKLAVNYFITATKRTE